jgi:hypothetical protein
MGEMTERDSHKARIMEERNRTLMSHGEAINEARRGRGKARPTTRSLLRIEYS